MGRTTLVALLCTLAGCANRPGAVAAPAVALAEARSPWAIAIASDDATVVARSVDAALLELSPWQRALHAAHDGDATRLGMFVVPDDVARPSTRPDAPAIEAATISALERWSGVAGTAATARARARLLVLLAEVGEAAASRWLAERLGEARERSEDAVALMRALETIHGLPAFYEPYAMQCGEPGPPEMTAAIAREHAATQDRRYRDGRRALLDWLAAHAAEPREQRVRAALAAWDARRWIAQPDRAPEGLDFSPALRFRNVVRIGDGALPGLRARKRDAVSDRDAAVFETLAAAISGELDAALVGRLLATDAYDQDKGIEIVAAARSTDFIRELDQLQRSRSYEVADLASATLAAVHGRDALPLMRAAVRDNPDNTTAALFVEELEHLHVTR